METFVTDKELADIVEDLIKEIWKAKNEIRSEFRAEIKQLEMNMLIRFDHLTDRWEEFEEKIDKKHSARFDRIEKRLNSLEKNVKLILKHVSKVGGKKRD